MPVTNDQQTGVIEFNNGCHRQQQKNLDNVSPPLNNLSGKPVPTSPIPVSRGNAPNNSFFESAGSASSSRFSGPSPSTSGPLVGGASSTGSIGDGKSDVGASPNQHQGVRHSSPHSDSSFIGYRGSHTGGTGSSRLFGGTNSRFRGWSDIGSTVSSSSTTTAGGLSRSPSGSHKSRLTGGPPSISSGSSCSRKIASIFRHQRQLRQAQQSNYPPTNGISNSARGPEAPAGGTGYPVYPTNQNCNSQPCQPGFPGGQKPPSYSQSVSYCQPAQVPYSSASQQHYPNMTPPQGCMAGNHNSNAKLKSANVFAPCKGKVSLTIYYTFGRITIHVMEARGLRSLTASSCNPFIRVSLFPDNAKMERFETEVYRESANPLYDVKFTFEIAQTDYNKRILLSVWNKLVDSDGFSEFLGCMSFGIKSFISKKQQVAGWYYLLTDQMGRTKHRSAPNDSMAGNIMPGVPPNIIPETNRVLSNMQVYEIIILRGPRGFGFTLGGACPVYVTQVDAKGPAQLSGLKLGDFIVKIDGVNVSRSTTESVVRMIRVYNKTLNLVICRPLDPTPTRPLPPVPAVNPQGGISVTKSPPPPTFRMLPTSCSQPRGPQQNSQGCNSVNSQSSSVPLPLTSTTSLSNGNLTSLGMTDASSRPSSGHPASRGQQLDRRRDPMAIDDNVTSSRSPSPTSKFPHPAMPLQPGTCHDNSKTSSAPTQNTSQNNCVIQASNGQAKPGSDIVGRFQYLGHLKQVNFQRFSPHLELSGPVHLIEGNSRFLLDLFLFPDVLIFGQSEPDGFITIIKEPIYNVKISYCSIPANTTNELILQYINESGKKLFIHLQAANARDWLARIQSHMLYNCNWWSNNIA